MSAWRPIADAPKDGTHILVCGNGVPVSITYWYVHWLNGKPSKDRQPEWYQQHLWGDNYWGPIKPTHWMPLPEHVEKANG